MSVVGSRSASCRGLEITAKTLRILVDRGLSVISGLATGVDASAHRAAMTLFPAAYVVMPGCAMATIVLEAGEHSGARIQTRRAVQHGWPVVLTDMVATSTDWGRELVGRPGAQVAGGIDDVARTVDELVKKERDFGRLLDDVIATAHR